MHTKFFYLRTKCQSINRRFTGTRLASEKDWHASARFCSQVVEAMPKKLSLRKHLIVYSSLLNTVIFFFSFTIINIGIFLSPRIRMRLKVHCFEGMSSSHFHLNCINNIMCSFLLFHFPYCTEVDLNQIFM